VLGERTGDLEAETDGVEGEEGGDGAGWAGDAEVSFEDGIWSGHYGHCGGESGRVGDLGWFDVL
jgi:hypothetical protein